MVGGERRFVEIVDAVLDGVNLLVEAKVVCLADVGVEERKCIAVVQEALFDIVLATIIAVAHNPVSDLSSHCLLPPLCPSLLGTPIYYHIIRTLSIPKMKFF